ncbi:hypothetical protein HK102_013617 [Quaeritorhiza haematococci]|nr:hypothetical protein HK102_013617 [Quaeritorhiza haematococci]
MSTRGNNKIPLATFALLLHLIAIIASFLPSTFAQLSCVATCFINTNPATTSPPLNPTSLPTSLRTMCTDTAVRLQLFECFNRCADGTDGYIVVNGLCQDTASSSSSDGAASGGGNVGVGMMNGGTKVSGLNELVGGTLYSLLQKLVNVQQVRDAGQEVQRLREGMAGLNAGALQFGAGPVV